VRRANGSPPPTHTAGATSGAGIDGDRRGGITGASSEARVRSGNRINLGVVGGWAAGIRSGTTPAGREAGTSVASET